MKWIILVTAMMCTVQSAKAAICWWTYLGSSSTTTYDEQTGIPPHEHTTYYWSLSCYDSGSGSSRSDVPQWEPNQGPYSPRIAITRVDVTNPHSIAIEVAADSPTGFSSANVYLNGQTIGSVSLTGKVTWVENGPSLSWLYQDTNQYGLVACTNEGSCSDDSMTINRKHADQLESTTMTVYFPEGGEPGGATFDHIFVQGYTRFQYDVPYVSGDNGRYELQRARSRLAWEHGRTPFWGAVYEVSNRAAGNDWYSRMNVCSVDPYPPCPPNSSCNQMCETSGVFGESPTATVEVDQSIHLSLTTPAYVASGRRLSITPTH